MSPERGGSPAGLSECGDSDLRVLSAATQEAERSLATPTDVRSSATPADAAVEILPCSATMCECAHSFAQRFCNSKRLRVIPGLALYTVSWVAPKRARRPAAQQAARSTACLRPACDPGAGVACWHLGCAHAWATGSHCSDMPETRKTANESTVVLGEH